MVWGCGVRLEVRWGGVWCEGGEIRSGCGWSI